MGLGFFFAISMLKFGELNIKNSNIISLVAISLVIFTIIPNLLFSHLLKFMEILILEKFPLTRHIGEMLHVKGRELVTMRVKELGKH